MSEMSFEWTTQQDRALKDVDRWLRAGATDTYRLDGYAGTGKTTLARHLAADVSGPVYFMAYTGKAAHVLRKSGVPNASTIHSNLYAPTFKNRAHLFELQRQLTSTELHPDDEAELRAEIRFEEARLRRPGFVLREDCPLFGASLLVVDEHSMIDYRVGADLEALGVPLLLLGDPMQLPPVHGAGYFMQRAPDMMLTEITRQALDSPIIRYATAIRETGTLPFGDDGKAKKVPRRRVTDDMLPRAGQLLCGKNVTRRALNATMRQQLHHDSLLPVVGERLVCLKNDRETGLLNGMVVTALTAPAHVDAKGFTLSVDNDGMRVDDVTINAWPFTQPEKCVDGWERDGAYPMDYGYALTVHKAQGSQWDKVCVMDDGFAKREPKTRQRWLYTAITRAADQLVIVA